MDEDGRGFLRRRQKSAGLLRRSDSKVVRYVLFALLNVPMYCLYATCAWIAFRPYYLCVAYIISLDCLHLRSNHGRAIFTFMFGFNFLAALLLSLTLYNAVLCPGRCNASSYSRTFSAAYTDVACSC